MGTILDKANILTKTKLDNLDTKQYPNQAFITTDERDGELDENLAVQFAESERQKSKNLFDVTKAEPQGYSWQGVPSPFPNDSYISCGFIKIKPNTNYIFSLADSSITIRYTGALFYTADKTYIGYDECNKYTFKTPSNAEYMICQFWFESNPMNYKDIIQIEENSVATEFQPCSGQITHNGDAPVVFVESEIQKSKNLFNINAPKTVDGYHSFVNGNTITVEGGGSTETESVFGLIPVKENTTYYIGANVSNKRLLFRIYDKNKNVITSAIPNWVYNQYWKASYADFSSTEIRTQLTIPQGAKYLALQTSWQGSEYTISNLIISEYPDIENYQPYNGAITHNNDAPVVFTENERQKSKNLFNKDDVVIGQTLYGYVPIKGVKDRYTMSLQNYDGTPITEGAFGICKNPANANEGYDWFVSDNLVRRTSFQASIKNRPYVFFYPNTREVFNFMTSIFDVQIEEGEVATDYQPYNGPIVHEKDLLDRAMCLIDEIYLTNENFSSVSFENIGGKDGEVFKLIISGAAKVPADGHILFNNIDSGMQSLVISTYADEGVTGSQVASNSENMCPFRVDTGYFYGELTVGCNHLYNGSSLWYDLVVHQVNRSTGCNYFRHITGTLLDSNDLNRITVYFGANAYRGTRLKLYKLGGKLTA